MAGGLAADWPLSGLCHHLIVNNFGSVNQCTAETVEAGGDSQYSIVVPSFGLFNSGSTEDSHDNFGVLLGAEKVLGREVRWSDGPTSFCRRNQWY